MINPLRFRPGPVPEGDEHPGSEVEWADNALSNFFAWASTTLLPKWCQTPEHWTARWTAYWFTDCPCCLLFRGIMIGSVFGVLVASLAIVMMVALVIVTEWR